MEDVGAVMHVVDQTVKRNVMTCEVRRVPPIDGVVVGWSVGGSQFLRIAQEPLHSLP